LGDRVFSIKLHKDRPMLLSLPQDSQPVQEMFERFFATESTTARVRAAEPLGFDPALWKRSMPRSCGFPRKPAAAA
jgi:hypothetical protein